MKKTYLMMLAALAIICTTATLSSCGNDDEDNQPTTTLKCFGFSSCLTDASAFDFSTAATFDTRPGDSICRLIDARVNTLMGTSIFSLQSTDGKSLTTQALNAFQTKVSTDAQVKQHIADMKAIRQSGYSVFTGIRYYLIQVPDSTECARFDIN